MTWLLNITVCFLLCWMVIEVHTLNRFFKGNFLKRFKKTVPKLPIPPKLPDPCNSEQEKNGGDFPSLPFRDQGTTGACWACAASDAVAIQAYIDKLDGADSERDIIRLSAQQLRECCHKCHHAQEGDGNTMNQVLCYIQGDGLTTEIIYPWTDAKLTCTHHNKPKIYKVVHPSEIMFTGNYEIVTKCLKRGIIIAGMEIKDEYKDIKGPKILKAKCVNGPNHFGIITKKMVVNGEEVFVVRNSYGEDKGDGGLFYISATHENPLCIYNEMFIVVVEKWDQ